MRATRQSRIFELANSASSRTPSHRYLQNTAQHINSFSTQCLTKYQGMLGNTSSCLVLIMLWAPRKGKCSCAFRTRYIAQVTNPRTGTPGRVPPGKMCILAAGAKYVPFLIIAHLYMENSASTSSSSASMSDSTSAAYARESDAR